MPTDIQPALVGCGSYVPAFGRGSGRRRVVVPNGDEDAVTLAIEAAQDCLRHALPGGVDEVHLALARPELTGGPQSEVVREALGMPSEVGFRTMAADALAGLSALQSAADAVTSGRVGSVLVIASEPGDGEAVSAAAVAVLVAARGGPGVRLTRFHSEGDVTFGHWSDSAGTHHAGDVRYLEVRVSDLAGQVMSAAEIGPDAIRAVTGVAASAVARSCGLGADVVFPNRGVAGPLWTMLATLGTCGSASTTVLASTASRVFAVRAMVEDGAAPLPVPAEPVDRDLAEPTEVAASPPLSLPGSSPFFQRSARELLRLEGARCRSCAHVVFPPSQRPICARCQATEFDPTPLSRTGSIYTWVVNCFLPVGFGDQMAFVLGEMDDGSRYWAPTSGIDPSKLEIGLPVELRVRRFTGHGGAPTYAMKFVPRRPGAPSSPTAHDTREVA